MRLRLINTDSAPHSFDIGGTPFRVVAIDGTDLVGPTPLTGRTLVLAAGGRYDVAFTMPRDPSSSPSRTPTVGLALSARRDAPIRRAPPPGPEFDPAAYGRPAPTPFGAVEPLRPRRSRSKLTRKPGFFDGQPGLQWAINGGIFPRVPMFMVETGDLVRDLDREHARAPCTRCTSTATTCSCSAATASRSRGSPWWSDTLERRAGRAATTSPSGPTTPASGWITATT